VKERCSLCKGSGWLDIIDINIEDSSPRALQYSLSKYLKDAICPLCNGKGYLDIQNVPPQRFSQD
jgi:RecJ-like exonuclease